jgi:hypothetical protein
VDKDVKFAWLQNWTAQVDLTLQIIDNATLSPGASLTEPFHNGYSAAAGPSTISTKGVLGTTLSAIPQGFAIAAGVSLNGQAQRTETLSFVLSVKELKEWRDSPQTRQLCAISDNMDLRGRLGLKEWVHDALLPVATDRELLYAGYHPKPAGAPGSAQPSAQGPKIPTPPAAIAAILSPDEIASLGQSLGQCPDE